MNTQPQHIFRLGFLSDQNTTLGLNLPLADTSIAAETVRTAMDSMIASGVISRHGKVPVARKSARITTQTVTDFVITPTL